MTKYTGLILFVMMSLSCTVRHEPDVTKPLDRAEIGGISLTLHPTEDGCRLSYSLEAGRGAVDLTLPTESRFHRDANGSVRVVRVGDLQVCLVESSRPDPDNPGDCDTRIQGVIVSNGSVSASQAVSKVASCPPFDWDDKMFRSLAE